MTKSIEKRGVSSLIQSSTISGQAGKILVFGGAFYAGAWLLAAAIPFLVVWHVIAIGAVLGIFMWER